MRSKWFIRLLAVGAAAALPAVTASAASAATLNGAGSTFVAPLEQEWGAAWGSQTGNTVNYQVVGSGAGLKDIGQSQVDFGASDAPLSASTTPCNGCSQMPWALSGDGIGFHINGVHHLRLTGQVVAQIYLGQITNWDDKRIKKLQTNGTHLPNLKITPLWRTDGSGTTYVFTDYESDVSSAFASKIGKGVSVNFPVGVGALHNSGVVAQLAATNGAISYNEVTYLIASWPHAAAIKNNAGNWVTPNYGNIQTAASWKSSVGGNNEIHIVNPPARFKAAYPISSYTYVILKNGQGNNALAKQFIQWAITSGQSFGPRLDFVPIPAFIRNADQSTLNNVH